MFCDYLRNKGVANDQILSINLEDPDYHDIRRAGDASFRTLCGNQNAAAFLQGVYIGAGR